MKWKHIPTDFNKKRKKERKSRGAWRKVEAHTKIHQKAPPQAALNRDFCVWECVGAQKGG